MSLPPELLAEIFLLCTTPVHFPTPGIPHRPQILLRVCSYWNQVVSSMSYIWTELTFCFPGTPMSPLLADSVTAWLRYSKELPLFIIIAGDPQPSQLATLAAPLSSVAHRIKSLELQFARVGERGYDMAAASNFAEQATVLADRLPPLPQIQRAVLIGLSIRAVRLPWQQITAFVGFHFTLREYWDTLNLLSSNLITANFLLRDDKQVFDSTGLPALVLPHLTDLRVVANDLDDDVNPFFPLTAPNLVFIAADAVRCSHIADFIHRSKVKLERLLIVSFVGQDSFPSLHFATALPRLLADVQSSLKYVGFATDDPSGPILFFENEGFRAHLETLRLRVTVENLEYLLCLAGSHLEKRVHTVSLKRLEIIVTPIRSVKFAFDYPKEMLEPFEALKARGVMVHIGPLDQPSIV
ncbi:F-box domain-containing protein [Mycena kentingensis (nom. inval.)]|nr:F-box domain-containing protein [Mycena kentingensis (nom. inval.)]